MTKQEYIDKWRGVYVQRKKRIQILSNLLENIDIYHRVDVTHCKECVEAEARTIYIMLSELEDEVE